jgi:UDP-glucose:(heptosyl)LPS alpha-1,3-glucosyltransferase
MRVAFMHRALAGGGTEADLRQMAVGLAARGHDLHVFTAKPAPLDGVTVHRVPLVRAGRTVRLLSFGIVAPRQVRRQTWDVVVGFGRTVAQDVVRVGGGTHRSYLTAMERAGLRGRRRGPYHQAILWLERRMFAAAQGARVLAVSRRVADEVMRDYAVGRVRVRVIYNGVDLERFHPRLRAVEYARVRGGLGIDTTRVCVAVGTGFARKGFDALLACWERCPPRDTTLVVAGNDERLAAYRRRFLSDRTRGAVRILGPRDDVPALLAAADVLCLPSRQEAFGNVVLEALATGVPVVATRTVGATELLDGRATELLVDDPDDAVALAGTIERALDDEWEVRRQAARALAERHPWSRHVDDVERLLAEVCHGR